MQHVNVKIYGEVQGVGFRDAAYWTARKLHIAGFIMNEPEGGVYIEAEGDDDALNEFLMWCRKGPSTAKVEKIDVEWSEPRGKFTGFRIG